MTFFKIKISFKTILSKAYEQDAKKRYPQYLFNHFYSQLMCH